jgi:hypothetical protein
MERIAIDFALGPNRANEYRLRAIREGAKIATRPESANLNNQRMASDQNDDIVIILLLALTLYAASSQWSLTPLLID